MKTMGQNAFSLARYLLLLLLLMETTNLCMAEEDENADLMEKIRMELEKIEGLIERLLKAISLFITATTTTTPTTTTKIFETTTGENFTTVSPPYSTTLKQTFVYSTSQGMDITTTLDVISSTEEYINSQTEIILPTEKEDEDSSKNSTEILAITTNFPPSSEDAVTLIQGTEEFPETEIIHMTNNSLDNTTEYFMDDENYMEENNTTNESENWASTFPDSDAEIISPSMTETPSFLKKTSYEKYKNEEFGDFDSESSTKSMEISEQSEESTSDERDPADPLEEVLNENSISNEGSDEEKINTSEGPVDSSGENSIEKPEIKTNQRSSSDTEEGGTSISDETYTGTSLDEDINTVLDKTSENSSIDENETDTNQFVDETSAEKSNAEENSTEKLKDEIFPELSKHISTEGTEDETSKEISHDKISKESSTHTREHEISDENFSSTETSEEVSDDELLAEKDNDVSSKDDSKMSESIENDEIFTKISKDEVSDASDGYEETSTEQSKEDNFSDSNDDDSTEISEDKSSTEISEEKSSTEIANDKSSAEMFKEESSREYSKDKSSIDTSKEESSTEMSKERSTKTSKDASSPEMSEETSPEMSVESPTDVSTDESSTEISKDESSTEISESSETSEGKSSIEILEDKSSAETSNDKSSTEISEDRSSTEISDESSKDVSTDKSSTEISDESLRGVSIDESSTETSEDKSSTEITDESSTDVSIDESSTETSKEKSSREISIERTGKSKSSTEISSTGRAESDEDKSSKEKSDEDKPPKENSEGEISAEITEEASTEIASDAETSTETSEDDTSSIKDESEIRSTETSLEENSSERALRSEILTEVVDTVEDINKFLLFFENSTNELNDNLPFVTVGVANPDESGFLTNNFENIDGSVPMRSFIDGDISFPFYEDDSANSDENSAKEYVDSKEKRTKRASGESRDEKSHDISEIGDNSKEDIREKSKKKKRSSSELSEDDTSKNASKEKEEGRSKEESKSEGSSRNISKPKKAKRKPNNRRKRALEDSKSLCSGGVYVDGDDLCENIQRIFTETREVARQVTRGNVSESHLQILRENADSLEKFVTEIENEPSIITQNFNLSATTSLLKDLDKDVKIAEAIAGYNENDVQDDLPIFVISVGAGGGLIVLSMTILCMYVCCRLSSIRKKKREQMEGVVVQTGGRTTNSLGRDNLAFDDGERMHGTGKHFGPPMDGSARCSIPRPRSNLESYDLNDRCPFDSYSLPRDRHYHKNVRHQDWGYPSDRRSLNDYGSTPRYPEDNENRHKDTEGKGRKKTSYTDLKDERNDPYSLERNGDNVHRITSGRLRRVDS